MSDLMGEIERVIQDRKLFQPNQFILVAVSGGLDSMVLLHLLRRLADRHGWMPVVAHFNHQLRGSQSDADEAFVRKTARKLGLKFICERGNAKKHARRHGLSIEMAARQLRHEFLARAASSLGIPTVALGHHANDQVELFFLRLLRGAGPEGLAGMKWVSPSPCDANIRLVRPLLQTPREALEQFARSERIRFREDATNAQVDFERNRIRHELLPFIRRKFHGNLGKAVLRTMEILAGESEFVRHAAQAWTPDASVPFDRLHASVQRQVIHSELLRIGVAPEFDLVERLRCVPDEPVSVSAEATVRRDARGVLHLQRLSPVEFSDECQEIELSGRGGEMHFGGVAIHWRKGGRPKGNLPGSARPGFEQFDAGKVGSRIVLRHWRPGDRFQPIGMSRAVKLQDLFTNQKIPREERRRLVVATTADGELFWVEGLRMSAQFKLDKSTTWVLKWNWRRSAMVRPA